MKDFQRTLSAEQYASRTPIWVTLFLLLFAIGSVVSIYIGLKRGQSFYNLADNVYYSLAMIFLPLCFGIILKIFEYGIVVYQFLDQLLHPAEQPERELPTPDVLHRKFESDDTKNKHGVIEEDGLYYRDDVYKGEDGLWHCDKDELDEETLSYQYNTGEYDKENDRLNVFRYFLENRYTQPQPFPNFVIGNPDRKLPPPQIDKDTRLGPWIFERQEGKIVFDHPLEYKRPMQSPFSTLQWDYELYTPWRRETVRADYARKKTRPYDKRNDMIFQHEQKKMIWDWTQFDYKSVGLDPDEFVVKYPKWYHPKSLMQILESKWEYIAPILEPDPEPEPEPVIPYTEPEKAYAILKEIRMENKICEFADNIKWRLVKFIRSEIRAGRIHSRDHTYEVVRCAQLAQDISFHDFIWDRGGVFEGQEWEEGMPTDTEVVMLIFSRYMDSLSINPDEVQFYPRYIYNYGETIGDKIAIPCDYSIRLDNLNPPHYNVYYLKNKWNCIPGSLNVYGTIALFLWTLIIYNGKQCCTYQLPQDMVDLFK
ncbi:hypothetical protein WA158_000604 [Blastocystis sp. Blastoise]